MKIYEKPEIQIETFEVEDIITASGEPIPNGEGWMGGNSN